MLTTFINARLSAEADAVCGAAYNARSDERVTSRNGYRHRDLDTRVGTIEVAIPKLRSGTYFRDWLLDGAAGLRPRCVRWWPPVTCWGCRPGGWASWSSFWGSPACRGRRYPRWPPTSIRESPNFVVSLWILVRTHSTRQTR